MASPSPRSQAPFPSAVTSLVRKQKLHQGSLELLGLKTQPPWVHPGRTTPILGHPLLPTLGPQVCSDCISYLNVLICDVQAFLLLRMGVSEPHLQTAM